MKNNDYYYDEFNNPLPKKDSLLSLLAAICGVFIITAPLGLVFGILDLLIGGKHKKHLGSYFGIIMGLLFILVFPKDDSSSNDNKNSNNKNNDNAIVDTVKEYDITNIESLPKVVTINNLQITINSYNLNYESDNIFYQLEENEKYISVSISYKNIDEDDVYVSAHDFTCYADNIVCEQVYVTDSDFINENLSYNRQVNFDIAFIVPVDTDSIEIEYKRAFKDDNAIFKLK